MIRPFARPSRLILLAAIAAAGCTGHRDAQQVPPATAVVADSARAVAQAHGLIGPAARAALDRGNGLFRKKAYDAALAEYRAAAALAPQHAAPLYGIYMVARATNNSAMADSALSGIKDRNAVMAPHAFDDSTLKRVHAKVPQRPRAG
jgi:hypothetical protein